MRFVWAVAAFVLAAVLIGAGIAQRTVFVGPKTQQNTVSVTEELPYTVVDGAVLNSAAGAQTLEATGEGAIFAAYGRTTDVQAWLSDATYNHITLDGSGEPVADVVEPTLITVPEDGTAEGDAADAAETAPAEETPGRNPAGSDLWLEEFSDEDVLTLNLELPETMSVLLAADGTLPAPSTVTVSWPIDNSTPWAGPLILAGSIVMALGVFLYILGLRHLRRSRGPRRKGLPPLPATEPLEVLPDAEAKGVISSGEVRSRRAISGRKAFIVLPAVAVSALLFTGCSAEAWPQVAVSPSPSPSATVLAPEGQKQPAVTEAQAERIIAEVAKTVADADAAGDGDLAATRLGGAVLDERKANYLIRTKVSEYPVLEAIPATPLSVTLPQAYDGWPRNVLAVVGDEEDETVAPVMMVLTQDDAWSPYKLTYLAHVSGSAGEFPNVASATVGAAQVPPESSFLTVAPEDLATAYADVLNNGEASPSYALFDTEADQFRVRVADDRTTRLETFNQTGAQTGSLTFSSAPGAYEPMALATLESGAIIAVSLTETDTVKPTTADAVIKLDGNETVQALAGASTSVTGFQTNFSDQLFFYVPNQAAGGKVQLLGYASNILSAGVIQ